MSFIDNISVGTSYTKTPYIGVIYGKGGTGKTGVSVYAPSPFFICLEHGTKWIFGSKQLEGMAQTFLSQNGNIVMPSTCDDFFDALRWLCSRKNIESIQKPIKTIVIDGMAFLERMFYIDLVSKNPVKNDKPVLDIIDLGYDGQLKAMEYWEKLFSGCERLRSIGLNVILITHAIKRNDDHQDGTRYKFIDMELQSFGNANVPNLFAKRCDFVYYIDSAVQTSSSGSGKWQRKIASSRSDSVFQVHTRQTPAFYAKSRSIDASVIPDMYEFTMDDRAEVSRKIFEDLDKC